MYQPTGTRQGRHLLRRRVDGRGDRRAGGARVDPLPRRRGDGDGDGQGGSQRGELVAQDDQVCGHGRGD